MKYYLTHKRGFGDTTSYFEITSSIDELGAIGHDIKLVTKSGKRKKYKDHSLILDAVLSGVFLVSSIRPSPQRADSATGES